MTTQTGLPLFVLGRSADPHSEKGVDCPGELPPASDPQLVERARRAKEALGDRLFVLGHHYQRDEVIQFADVTGDSFKLAQQAAARPQAEYIVFCGVHFMAESADILTTGSQKVVLPDLAAGCSMADMATFDQVEEAWEALEDAGLARQRGPGHVHELQRRHQGVLRAQRRRGVHLVQRAPRPDVGVRAGQEGAVPA
ncbi:quinolinate synthase NadA [Nonomuraea ferruginea]